MLEFCLQSVIAKETCRNRFFDCGEGRNRASRLHTESAGGRVRCSLIEIGENPDVYAVFPDVGSSENAVASDFTLHIEMPRLHVSSRDVFGNIPGLRDQGVELTAAEIEALIRTDRALWGDAAARIDRDLQRSNWLR